MIPHLMYIGIKFSEELIASSFIFSSLTLKIEAAGWSEIVYAKLHDVTSNYSTVGGHRFVSNIIASLPNLTESHPRRMQYS